MNEKLMKVMNDRLEIFENKIFRIEKEYCYRMDVIENNQNKIN